MGQASGAGEKREEAEECEARGRGHREGQPEDVWGERHSGW
jgi:hypothetical protein